MNRLVGATVIDHQPLAGHDWIVATDVDDSDRDARIFRAAPLPAAEHAGPADQRAFAGAAQR